MEKELLRKGKPQVPARRTQASGRVATTLARKFFGHRFVYAVLSQRALGLSIGVNLNPDKACNFACVYCEVDRRHAAREPKVDVEVMAEELQQMLALARDHRVRELPGYQSVPEELLQLKEVALSGDGEPTLCPNFEEVVRAVVHIRAQHLFPFFKMVLITNATGLHLPAVQLGLESFTSHDEIWAKLDVGTQAHMDRINAPKPAVLGIATVGLDSVMENILKLACQRAVVIQSLFPLAYGHGPTGEEIEHYVQRLQELKQGGAKIPLVQVYSAHRPAMAKHIGHLPLQELSKIARRIREVTGLKAEVF